MIKRCTTSYVVYLWKKMEILILRVYYYNMIFYREYYLFFDKLSNLYKCGPIILFSFGNIIDSAKKMYYLIIY